MSEISEEATRLIDNFEYAVEDAVSDYTMAGGASYKNQARYNLEDYIAELEAAQRWIPVSERLPEKRLPVLVYTIYGETYSAMLLGEVWTGLHRDFRKGEVTHWMPLPEPPIVYGKVCEE